MGVEDRGSPPRSGRPAPTRDERRDGLLTTAEGLFMRRGFASTTMDDIASAAGISKKTLYRLFESKLDLFRAIIQRRPPRQGSAEEPDGDQRPAAQLKLWLRRIASVALSPREVALQRLVVREALVAPDLARVFADAILDRGPNGLVNSLGNATLRPPLRACDPHEVADMLIGVAFGGSHFRLMIGDEFRLDAETIDRRIDVAVRLFCEDG